MIEFDDAVQGDTTPTARYPITNQDGTGRDITAGNHSAELYYCEEGSDEYEWVQTLTKGGSGASSYFEFKPSSTHPLYPSGFSGRRHFVGHVRYQDTSFSPTLVKWYEGVLHVHISPSPVSA